MLVEISRKKNIQLFISPKNENPGFRFDFSKNQDLNYDSVFQEFNENVV